MEKVFYFTGSQIEEYEVVYENNKYVFCDDGTCNLYGEEKKEIDSHGGRWFSTYEKAKKRALKCLKNDMRTAEIWIDKLNK